MMMGPQFSPPNYYMPVYMLPMPHSYTVLPVAQYAVQGAINSNYAAAGQAPSFR